MGHARPDRHIRLLTYLMRFSSLLYALPLVAAISAWAVENPSAALPDAMPVREAYTDDHQLLVRLLSVPNPIPMAKYFSLQLAVYDGSNPHQQLTDAQVQIAAGMSHGMTQGFMHEMQSSPRIETQNGIATVSGMFFHMTGEWTLRVTAHTTSHDGTVLFNLPCCEQ